MEEDISSLELTVQNNGVRKMAILLNVPRVLNLPKEVNAFSLSWKLLRISATLAASDLFSCSCWFNPN